VSSGSGSKGSNQNSNLDESAANLTQLAAEASLTPWWDATTRLIGSFNDLGSAHQKNPVLNPASLAVGKRIAEGWLSGSTVR